MSIPKIGVLNLPQWQEDNENTAHPAGLPPHLNIALSTDRNEDWMRYCNHLLIQAIDSGDNRLCLRLLATGVSLDIPDAQGNTPLFYATWIGSHHIIRTLTISGVGKPANVNHRNEEGISPLMYAVFHMKVEAVRALLATSTLKVDLQAPDGSTALMFAVSEYCKNKKPELITIIELLLSHSASATLQANDGEYALPALLHSFSRSNPRPDLAKSLYEKDPNPLGEKALRWAQTLNSILYQADNREIENPPPTTSTAKKHRLLAYPSIPEKVAILHKTIDRAINMAPHCTTVVIAAPVFEEEKTPLDKIIHLLAHLTTPAKVAILHEAIYMALHCTTAIIAPMLRAEKAYLDKAIRWAIDCQNDIALDILLNVKPAFFSLAFTTICQTTQQPSPGKHLINMLCSEKYKSQHNPVLLLKTIPKALANKSISKYFVAALPSYFSTLSEGAFLHSLDIVIKNDDEKSAFRLIKYQPQYWQHGFESACKQQKMRTATRLLSRQYVKRTEVIRKEFFKAIDRGCYTSIEILLQYGQLSPDTKYQGIEAAASNKKIKRLLQAYRAPLAELTLFNHTPHLPETNACGDYPLRSNIAY